MEIFNNFDLDIKKIQANNDPVEGFATMFTCEVRCTNNCTDYNSCGVTCGGGCRR